eukprot:scaffold111694_cov66-Phaeocystis_antarctica.AAC.4
MARDISSTNGSGRPSSSHVSRAKDSMFSEGSRAFQSTSSRYERSCGGVICEPSILSRTVTSASPLGENGCQESLSLRPRRLCSAVVGSWGACIITVDGAARTGPAIKGTATRTPGVITGPASGVMTPGVASSRCFLMATAGVAAPTREVRRSAGTGGIDRHALCLEPGAGGGVVPHGAGVGIEL